MKIKLLIGLLEDFVNTDNYKEITYPGYKRIPVEMEQDEKDIWGKLNEEEYLFPDYHGIESIPISYAAVFNTAGQLLFQKKFASIKHLGDDFLPTYPCISKGDLMEEVSYETKAVDTTPERIEATINEDVSIEDKYKTLLIKYAAQIQATEQYYQNDHFCVCGVGIMEFTDYEKKVLNEEIFPRVREWYEKEGEDVEEK